MSKRYSKKIRKQGNEKNKRPTPAKHFTLNPNGLPAKLTYDFGPKSRPAPKPVTAPKCQQARMEKFTSKERELLMQVNRELVIGKRHGDFGYCMKLVKRGWWAVTYQGKYHNATFTPTTEGNRIKAGFERAFINSKKQALTSGNNLPQRQYEQHVATNRAKVVAQVAAGLQ